MDATKRTEIKLNSGERMAWAARRLRPVFTHEDFEPRGRETDATAGNFSREIEDAPAPASDADLLLAQWTRNQLRSAVKASVATAVLARKMRLASRPHRFEMRTRPHRIARRASGE